MASRLEKDLTCCLCCELFRDPVLLSCDHSFCKVCLETCWRSKPIKTCPLCYRICKRKSSEDFLPLNLSLKNLVQTFAEQRDRAPEQRDRAPEQREQRDRVPEQRDRVPEQRDRAPEQRERAPEQREQAPEQRDRVPEQRDQEQRERAPEQRERTPEQRDRAPEQREQRDRAPEQRERTPEQRDRAPEQREQRDRAPEQREQRDRAPERRDRTSEQRHRAPEQRERAPEQRERTPEQRDPERRDRTPEQRHRAPEQRHRAPEQRERAPEQRHQAPEQRERTPEQRDPEQRDRAHTDCGFSPIDTAASDLRQQLQTSIQPLRDKLQVLSERKEQFKEAEDHITAQTRQTQQQIRRQFEKLHQFLLEEEESRMGALRKEEEQKTQKMKDKIVSVSREMETVSKTIAETEEQLRATDTSFLLQYKTTAETVQRCPLVDEPRMERGALIDQAKHLGNLSFNIWRNMKRLVHFYPVILDPNRAGPALILSEDLSEMKYRPTQKLPQNPDRLGSSNVFGSEVFRSGTHSWDVEVGDNKHWAVGVWGRAQRKEQTKAIVWIIRFTENKYSAFCSLPRTVSCLSVKSLQRVRVKMDFGRGTLTFSDADTNTHLHTFTHTFTEVVPVLVTENNFPLKILAKTSP